MEASNIPFAMVVLTAKLALFRPVLKDQQLFDMAFDLAKRLLMKQIPKEKIRKLINFLRYYVRFENTEMITKFEKEISNLTEGTITMGIEEFLLDQAKREGMTEKGMEKDSAFTKNLLTSTDFSILKIAQLVGVSEDFVLKVKNSLNK